MEKSHLKTVIPSVGEEVATGVGDGVAGRKMKNAI
jgi:hypothetical protein